MGDPGVVKLVKEVGGGDVRTGGDFLGMDFPGTVLPGTDFVEFVKVILFSNVYIYC